MNKKKREIEKIECVNVKKLIKEIYEVLEKNFIPTFKEKVKEKSAKKEIPAKKEEPPKKRKYTKRK